MQLLLSFLDSIKRYCAQSKQTSLGKVQSSHFYLWLVWSNESSVSLPVLLEFFQSSVGHRKAKFKIEPFPFRSAEYDDSTAFKENQRT